MSFPYSSKILLCDTRGVEGTLLYPARWWLLWRRQGRSGDLKGVVATNSLEQDTSVSESEPSFFLENALLNVWPNFVWLDSEWNC